MSLDDAAMYAGTMRQAAADAAETETLVRVAAVEPLGYHGHGPLAGVPVHLLRLGMCNLACDWCEAPETVAALGAVLDTTAPYVGLRDLAARLQPQLTADYIAPLLITGGEPLVQDHAILALLPTIDHAGPVWVETNGTIAPPDWWEDYVSHTIVSPKVSTHDPQHRRLTSAQAAWADLALAGVATFDFTCANRSDVLLAVNVCTWLGLSPASCTITPRAGQVTPTRVQGRYPAVGQQASLNVLHAEALAYGFQIATRPLLDPRSVQ